MEMMAGLSDRLIVGENRLQFVFRVVLLGLVLFLGGCEAVKNAAVTVTERVDNLFGQTEETEQLSGQDDGAYPDLGSVPASGPTVSSQAQLKSATDGLVADREKAEYTEQVARSEPINVRPLDETRSVPDGAGMTPVVPAAVSVPAAPSVQSAAGRASLAERLGAAPPPPPPMSASGSPPPPPPSTVIAPAAASEAMSTSTLNPAVSSNTTSSSADPSSTQMASLPNSLNNYAPGVFSVSSHVATIQFESGSAQLTSKDRSALEAVLKLREEYGGLIRVIGHASSRTRDLDPMKHKLVNFRISMLRANAVAAELLRKGLAAKNLSVGAVSDSEPVYFEVMPSGDEGNQRAEIYLDY